MRGEDVVVPGGISESIAHFIGYLHLPEDPSRTHQKYDGGVSSGHAEAWSTNPQHALPPARSFDDLPTRPIPNAYQPQAFSLIKVGKHKLAPPPPLAIPHPHLGAVPSPDAGPHDPGVPSADLVLVRSDATEVWTPAPKPDQLIADLKQINLLQNDATVFTGRVTPADACLAASHATADAAHLAHLVAVAQAGTPDWMPATPHNQDLVAATVAHDADLAGHPAATAPVLLPGVYADGALQPAGTLFSPTAPTPVDLAETSHNGMANPGADAQTGGNTAVNVASIIDDHTQHTGLAVMGNVYTTDAIVQTNVLQSVADIVVGGAAAQASTDGNAAHNLASFAQHDLSSSFVASGTPWGHLQVDTIDGNFYDVKGFAQLNYVSSNDVVVQSASTAFSEVDSGHNLQVNDLPIAEIAQNYDLIIVQGSFHNANFIVQQNVFLNDDVVRMLSERGDTASETVSTGGNTLQNSAAIDHYGATVYQPLGADMTKWLGDLEAGHLDPAGGIHLPSVGSAQMHVLYIKGDFFDINYLSQTNVVSNADAVAQYMPNAGAAFGPNGAPTSSTMAVDAGHNQLANLASIAVVGTTSGFQFLVGQHYDDAILVQANLVSDKASVTMGDTHTLANELVAFTGLHDAGAASQDHTAVMPTDPSLHHDLFHGMLT